MELTTIDIDTFTDKELVKVFNYVATKVIGKTPFKAKRQLKIKKGEKIHWGHVIKLLEWYGVPLKMSFSYDEKTPKKTLALSRINYNRIVAGLKALPEPVVETVPED